MLPFKLIYGDGYDLNLGRHVFPAQKYRLIRERLLEEKFAEAGDFLEPRPASDEELLAVHTREWVTKLKTGTLDYVDILRLEIPFSHEMVEAARLATGGTILAAERALGGDGVGLNIGGGFHHAFAGHGEGFCAINDVAISVRSLQRRNLVRKAIVVDCDVHHGNGTAAIFHGDATVSTISIHQYDNYPAVKPPSTVDIHLADGVGGGEYLDKLRTVLETALAGFQPGILFYLAGADPYEKDQLGGLSLTIGDLERRDRLVFDAARAAGVPVAVTLAGGYAADTEDTVTIHCGTARAALKAFS